MLIIYLFIYFNFSPNSLIKKIRPIPISKIVYAPSERKLKLRQLKIDTTD